MVETGELDSPHTSKGSREQPAIMAPSIRRQLNLLMEDIREIRDQGRKAAADPTEVPLFKGMYGTLVTLFDRYNQLYNRLADLTDESGINPIATAEDHLNRRTAKRYVHEAHASMVTSNDAAQAGAATNATVVGNTTVIGNSRARAKLPIISLTPFDGDRRSWPRFRDLFESLVIGDPELTDIDRYHYLVASVKDTASSIISHLPLTATNFNLAWTTLKDVFDNRRLLAASYLDQLLELKPLEKRPSSDVLSNRMAELSEAVSAFKLLEIAEPTEFVFFHIASRALDSHSRIAFENANSAS